MLEMHIILCGLSVSIVFFRAKWCIVHEDPVLDIVFRRGVLWLDRGCLVAGNNRNLKLEKEDI